MKSRMHARKKSTREQTPDFSTAPAQPMFQSRSFVVQTQQAEQSPQQDLKTALRRAERYGHHLGRMHPAGFSAAAVQPQEGKVHQEASERKKSPPILQTKLAVGTQEVIQRTNQEDIKLNDKVELLDGRKGTITQLGTIRLEVKLEDTRQTIRVPRFQIKQVLSEQREAQQESLEGSAQTPMSVTSGQQSGTTRTPPPALPPRRTKPLIPPGSAQTPMNVTSGQQSGTTRTPPPAPPPRRTKPLIPPGSAQTPMSVTSGQQSGTTRTPPPPHVEKEAQGGGAGQREMTLAQRFLMQAQRAADEKPTQQSSTSKEKVDTGRARITAPKDDVLIVYRGEKAGRNTLEQRRKQGGLKRWQPTSQNVQEAYDVMRKSIATLARGENISQQEWDNAVNAYAQKLRAEGQGDAIATARTIEGAYEDDYNYKIKIPGVKLFKWEGGKKGDQISPGEEIKKHYIVLNAEEIADSTIFGIGHVTGTQEVTFYSDIPGDMIESVQEKSFEAKQKKFKVPDGAKKGD